MYIKAGSKLTATDLHAAAHHIRQQYGQDFYIEEAVTSPRGALTFYGEAMHGTRRVNRQANSNAYAATWVAWGYFIAELFNRDPEATIGQYKGVEDFRRQCREAHDWFTRYGEDGGRKRPKDSLGSNIAFLDTLTGVPSYERTGVAS